MIDIFEQLYFELHPDRFCTLFKVCFVDNGTEFSNPKAIEYDRQGICVPVFFTAIQVLPIRKRLRNITLNLYSVFFRKKLTLLHICRKIFVSWWIISTLTAGKILEINALMMCFLFCMGENSGSSWVPQSSSPGCATQSIRFSQGGQPWE